MTQGDVKFNPLDGGTTLITPLADDPQSVGLIQDTTYWPDPSASDSPASENAITALLSYENRSVEVVIKSIGSQAPKLRLRIRSDGISLMPSQMTDFRCIYKMRW